MKISTFRPKISTYKHVNRLSGGCVFVSLRVTNNGFRSETSLYIKTGILTTDCREALKVENCADQPSIVVKNHDSGGPPNVANLSFFS